MIFMDQVTGSMELQNKCFRFSLDLSKSGPQGLRLPIIIKILHVPLYSIIYSCQNSTLACIKHGTLIFNMQCHSIC